MKRTATSTRDLERVEVMGRVAQEGLKLVDAAAMLQLSYRKVKRMWRRYQQMGGQGMNTPTRVGPQTQIAVSR